MENGHGKVEFPPPPGFKAPEMADPSKDWDMVCSFRTKPDGKICMTMLGKTPMPGYDNKQESKPNYSEYAKSMMSEMSSQNSERTME